MSLASKEDGRDEREDEEYSFMGGRSGLSKYCASGCSLKDNSLHRRKLERITASCREDLQNAASLSFFNIP
jgi:hypothetical protein